MREQLSSRAGVRAGFMGSGERNAIAFAHVGEPVRLEALGIEPPRHSQRAQPPLERRGLDLGPAFAMGGTEEELAVEASIVSDEDRVADPCGHLGEHRIDPRGIAKHRPRDPVDVGRSDSAESPGEANERIPLVVDRPVRIDGDDRELQDPVATGVETGGFDVDDGETGQRHGAHPTQWVWQGFRAQLAAAS